VSQSAALPEAIAHPASRKMTEADTYLRLLKKTLTRYPLALNEELTMLALRDMEPALIQQIIQWGMSGHSRIKGSNGFNPMLRSLGMDWPDEAETMIGLARLDNLEYCITSALQRNVPGDLVETGVWRGGAAIFMRAVLRAYGDVERKVWLADSFEGFPKPDEDNYPADRDSNLWTLQQLSVSLDNVKANFARYGLLDERVNFLPGWFSETLPTAPIDRIAVLRLDGAMYESTIVALRSLYQKVSPGGFVIIDDYNYVPQCQQAVDDFRREEDSIEALCPVDLVGVYWRVSALEKSRRRDNAKSLGASL
jgi:O-methyltransferase